MDKRKGRPRNVKNWNEEEIKFLRYAYECLNKKDIIQKLCDRTWMSITLKAKRMNLYRKEKIELNLTDSEKGYIAGLIDGEGTISFHNGGKFVNSPTVIITNTHKEAMEWVEQRIPHSRVYYRGETKTWNKIYVLHITHRETIETLLEELYYLLIIKKPQAEVILNYFKKHIKYGRKIRDNWGRFIKGVEEPIYCESIKKIKELNKRGVRDVCPMS